MVLMGEMCTKSEPFGQGQEEPQSIDGIDGHQNSLILLFLLPHTLKMADPSCNMERYSVWASSDQIWSTSIHRRRKELPFMVISENASSNTTEIASHMANPSWVIGLSLIWPHVCQFAAWARLF